MTFIKQMYDSIEFYKHVATISFEVYIVFTLTYAVSALAYITEEVFRRNIKNTYKIYSYREFTNTNYGLSN